VNNEEFVLAQINDTIRALNLLEASQRKKAYYNVLCVMIRIMINNQKEEEARHKTNFYEDSAPFVHIYERMFVKF